VEPWIGPQCSGIRNRDDVLIARIPTGELISVIEVEILTPGKHYGTCIQALLGQAEEMLLRQAAPVQASLHVGACNHDGADVFALKLPADILDHFNLQWQIE